MSKLFRVYKAFFLSSLIRELEFRANFFAKIAQNIGWIVFFVLIIGVVFSHTNSIAGWNFGEGIILGGTTFMMNGIVNLFTMSLLDVPSQVRLGSLDFIVTKPVDSQFWSTFRRFNLDQVGGVLVSGFMVGFGAKFGHVPITAAHFATWLLLTVCATVIFYCFILMLTTLSIWLVRIDNLIILSDVASSVARNPLDIYGANVRRILLFIVPLGFLGTAPAEALIWGVPPVFILAGLAWASASFVASRLLWLYAMRSYSSASS